LPSASRSPRAAASSRTSVAFYRADERDLETTYYFGVSVALYTKRFKVTDLESTLGTSFPGSE